MSEDTECPTCGRDDFKSVRGMKQHHKRTHGESISGVFVECDWCGNEFRMEPCQVEKYNRHFCPGERCKYEWVSNTRAGKNSPLWKDRVIVQCSYCGDNISKMPCRVEGDQRHFCQDSGCLYQWMSENKSGRDSVHWKGTDRKRIRMNYGPEWTESRRELVRDGQNRQCAGCGVSESVLWGRLHVHHIKPAEDCNPLEENQAWNLVALCPSCHKYYEHNVPPKHQKAKLKPPLMCGGGFFSPEKHGLAYTHTHPRKQPADTS